MLNSITILIALIFISVSAIAESPQAIFTKDKLEPYAKELIARIRDQMTTDEENITKLQQLRSENFERADRGLPPEPIPPHLSLSEERKRLRNDNCFGDDLHDKLVLHFHHNCGYDPSSRDKGFRICKKTNAEVSDYYKTIKNDADFLFTQFEQDNLETRNRTSGLGDSIEKLKQLREKISTVGPEIKKQNLVCIDRISSTLLNPNCLNTYPIVFNNMPVDVIAKACKPESITYQVNEFEVFMGKRRAAPVAIQEIANEYIQARKNEAEIALTAEKIDEIIRNYEAVLERRPTNNEGSDGG